MKKLIANNHGQTIIENVLAMGLLVVVFYMIVDGSLQLFKTESKTGQVSAEYQMVSQLIETIKGEPAVYQKNFVPNAGGINSYLATFPYGYAGNVLYTGNPPNCDSSAPLANGSIGGGGVINTFCDALMTYTIQPSLNYSGLFKGSIRVKHINKDPLATPTPDSNYYFLINTN